MSNTTSAEEGTTKRVLDHHLGAFAHGVEEILRDYDESSEVITPEKTFRGLSDIRGFFHGFLTGDDPEFWPAFKITNMTISGEIAYLAWEAKPWVSLATDTLLVKNGKIAIQTFTSFST